MNWFLFCWGVGIVCCFAYYLLVRKQFGLPFLKSALLCLCILFFEILGAKIMYVLENLSTFELRNLLPTSCYSLMGVFFFTPIFMVLLTFVFKVKISTIFDYYVPGILLELACYRVGCYLTGCCGAPKINGFQLPIQLIETGLDLALFGILLFVFLKYRPKEWWLTAITYAGYGLIRFVLEFFRVRTNIIGAFAPAHFMALGMIILGVALMIFSRFHQSAKFNISKRRK